MEKIIIQVLVFIKENLIAFISLLISIINLIIYIFSNIKNLDFVINNYTIGTVDEKKLLYV